MKHGFLFWVSLLYVSVVMGSCVISSNCYAYSFDEFLDFASIVKDLPQADSSQKTAASWLIDNQSTIRTRLTAFTSSYNTTFNSWIIGRNTSNGECGIIGYQNGEFNRWDSNGASIIKNATSEAGVQQTGGQYWNYGYGANKPLAFCLLKEEIAENVDFTGKIGNNYYNSFTSLEFDNSLENTAYNGNLFTYYYKGDFYSNKQLKLGDIIPNDSYYFEIRLKVSNTEIIKGTCFVALNTSPYTFYNDSAIYINENFELYAIPRLLSYGTQYQLEITSYYGDGNTNLEEDIDWFIFLPENATISGDYITSLGSGDFTEQDNTNTIIGFLNDNSAPSGDLQAILDISGNILSGDLFKDIKMPQVDGMNRTTLFDLLYAIAGTIGEDGDAYFDFQLHGETPTRVYASQFRTPDGPLKTLISSFLVFFTFYFLLLQIRHALEMLSTANIKGTLEYVDASLDNMFYM